MNVFLITLSGVIFSFQAQAYLDSGSGSMLVQLLLGGLVGAGAFIKFYWHKIIHFFRKKKD